MPPVYRIEVSANNRAGCKGSQGCKNAAIKLQKGELRFGILVEIKEHQSWQWRHWGCVTPKIIENLKEQSGGDMDLVDGYDELTSEFKKKVENALEQGHVDDEDWKGDPEWNRPGKTGFGPRGGKKKQKDEDDEEKEAPASAKKGGNKRKQQDDDEDVAPAKKPRGRPKKVVDEEEKVPFEKKPRGRPKKVVKDEEPSEAPKPNTSRARKTKVEPEPSDSETADEPASEPEKKPKKSKAKAKKAAQPTKKQSKKARSD